MWLCFNDGFVSVVADRNNKDRLMIRARRRQDLANVIGDAAEIVETSHADYRWRTFLGRDQFASLVTQRLQQIHYTNFKDSVADADLHDMYMKLWTTHYRYQQQDQ